jgi:hypothetical protein
VPESSPRAPLKALAIISELFKIARECN